MHTHVPSLQTRPPKVAMVIYKPSSNMDGYNILELIGEGSFGRVYKARRKYSKQVTKRKGDHVSENLDRYFPLLFSSIGRLWR